MLFCRAAESRLAACLSVVDRRNSGTRSVLVGQTLRRLPSSVEHQSSFVDLGNVLCKAVQFSEGDGVTSAVMASSVDHVWNDRGRQDAVDRVQAPSADLLARSYPCKKKRRWLSMPCRLDLQSCTWPFLGQQGVHAAAAFRGGICGGYLVVLLLVDDEDEDAAVEEEREVIYSNCPDSMWDRPGNYHLEGLTSDFTLAHPTGSLLPENFEPT